MVSSLKDLLACLEPEIEDPDEETFLLFCHERPSAQNLGFVDAHAAAVEVSVAGRDLVVHQSPAVLTSNRAGGTTGAVLWKITPIVADWLSRPDNVLFAPSSSGQAPLLGPHSAVLELGCGVSGVIGLALTEPGSSGSSGSWGSTTATGKSIKSSKGHNKSKRAAAKSSSALPSAAGSGKKRNIVGRYVLTDQAYVARFVQRNLEAHGSGAAAAATATAATTAASLVYFRSLDWETDAVSPALLRTEAEVAAASSSDTSRNINSNSSSSSKSRGWTSFDAVLACDCIYNEALVAPLVQTCVDACRLRTREGSQTGDDAAAMPTLCIVAQQLREPGVLTSWLVAFHAEFRVWRVPDDRLTVALRPEAGYAVHVGILRD